MQPQNSQQFFALLDAIFNGPTIGIPDEKIHTPLGFIYSAFDASQTSKWAVLDYLPDTSSSKKTSTLVEQIEKMLVDQRTGVNFSLLKLNTLDNATLDQQFLESGWFFEKVQYNPQADVMIQNMQTATNNQINIINFNDVYELVCRRFDEDALFRQRFINSFYYENVYTVKQQYFGTKLIFAPSLETNGFSFPKNTDVLLNDDTMLMSDREIKDANDYLESVHVQTKFYNLPSYIIGLQKNVNHVST